MIDSDKGSKARSLEGHAAVSMKRTGPDDLRWVEIQTTTFKNWVNEQLPDELDVTDMQTDFADGTKLIALVEALQSKLIRRVRSRNPQNQHQCLENLSIALDAIQRDKIKLVNIGAEDIAENNSKLILGLIWHLILRYQIGKTSYNPKNMMLIWLQNALPKCNIKNFSTSWNDGVALHALIDFCRPGSCPNWEKLDPKNSLENCRNAMNMGKEEFDIPLVVRPEDLASPHLDELSGMTYLSYYMKEHSPGYETTLNRVRRSLIKTDVTNFTTDWNDGQAVCELVEAAGGDVPNSSGTHEEILTKGLNASKVINIQPTLTAKQMAEEKEEHLGIMAYAVKFLGRVPESHNMSLTALLNNVHTEQKTQCLLELLDPSVEPSDVTIEVMGPTSRVPVNTEWKGKTAEIEFRPVEKGTHQLQVSHKGDIVGDCCKEFDVNSNKSNISYTEIDSCPNETLTEIKVKAHSARSGQIKVVTKSPTGKEYRPEMITKDGVHTAEFIPNEVGKWNVSILHVEEHIASSPFSVDVFDPSKVKIVGLEGGTLGKELSFKADFREAGEGNFSCVIYHESQQIPVKVDPLERGLAEVKFLPNGAGIYKIHGQFRNVDIKGSPYTLEIVDSDMVSVSGAGLELVPVNQAASFNIITKDAGGGEVKVNITSPSGDTIPTQLTGSTESGYQLEYTPTQVGLHEVSIAVNGEPIKDSPFQVQTYDASLVKVSQIPQGIVGVPCKLTVDTGSAGEGTLKAELFAEGVPVPCHVNDVTPTQCEVTLLGQQAVRHQLYLTFNSHNVSGIPYVIDYLDPGDIAASGEGLDMVCCQHTALFTVDTKGGSLSDLAVSITAPDGKEVPVKLKNKGDHTYQVEWTPLVIGDHKISICYANTPLRNSPFTAKVFDASLVTVQPATKGNLGKPVEFTVDTSEAGVGTTEICVKVNGDNVPNYVKQKEIDTHLNVSFTPQEPSKHLVHIRFNGNPVPGSPFPVRILNSDHIHVSGEALQLAPANTLASFKIDPKGADDGDVDIIITAPNGKTIPARLSGSPSSVYQVDFTPSQIGKHTIKVCCDDTEIKGSPFYCNVFDANLATVKGPARAYLNHSVTILVDVSKAGDGHLEAEAKCNGSLVRSNIQDLGSGCYEVTYTPRDTDTHMVTLLFNGYPLPGSPLRMNILDSRSVSATGDGLKVAQVHRTTGFDISAPGGDEDLDIIITRPSGSELPFSKTERGHNCHIEFSPREVGRYTIEAMMAGTPINGSPFYCNVYDPSLVRITNLDRAGKIKKDIFYTVDTSKSGEGDLKTSVTHHGRPIQTQREQLPDGNYRFFFIPEQAGQYEVAVQFNNEEIPGSPVIVTVESDVPKSITINFGGIEQINAKTSNWFHIELNGEMIDMNLLQILIRAPNGSLIPTKLVPQSNGDYTVEWYPVVGGQHIIDVLYDNKKVHNSPFTVEALDVNSIIVTDTYNSIINKPAGMTIDTYGAGKASNVITVLDPNGKSVPYETKEKDTKKEIAYIPKIAGEYQIYINFGGLELPGSPIIQKVGDGITPRVHGDGLYKGFKDEPTVFTVDSAQMRGDLFVQVDGPKSIAKCNVNPEEDGAYTVTYIPVEVGQYNINAKWDGQLIQGCPFHPKIYDIQKVRVVGGWQTYMDANNRIPLVINEKKKITFDVSEAGPGKLSAVVTDPHQNNVPVHLESSSPGIVALSFTPKVDGNYCINISWADRQLFGAPFIGSVASKAGQKFDSALVVLSGPGVRKAVVGQEAEFHIDGSKAPPGKPEVNVTGVRTEIPTYLISQGNQCYQCKYTPVFPGAYHLNIKWSGKQLMGCPYKITAITAPQPKNVTVTGDGLKGGMLGKDLQMDIDTRKAGLGELTAQCVGPHKNAYCELVDKHHGVYRLTVQPQEIGRHVLQIKFAGEDVLGSPYVLNIGTYPDASKVRVSGPGVEHGILATYESRFLVETKGAGAGQLSVRIKGPKGAFHVEMSRDSQKDRNITCCYNPYETGIYLIQVKWSGVDVPGSPFEVHIVDTHHEYEAIVRDMANHSNGYLDSPKQRHSAYDYLR